MLKEADQRWSVADSAELYEVARWGNSYFSISDEGHLLVHPTRSDSQFVDIKELVDRLELRGVDLPVLLRFNGILKDRLAEIHDAFSQSITEYGYRGTYQAVYPVKVNQQRQVVEEIVQHSQQFGFGLEAGSKPELLAVVAVADSDTPIICNGFKDAQYIEMALLAQKIGRNVIPVVEKYTELELILDQAERLNVRPQIGMRVKLATRGTGRWKSSGGYRSKFGLTVSEILRALDELNRRDMADCFKLLHFHLGSQMTNIRPIKSALIEAARVYTDLVKRGAGLEILDVGGGLGVDYDGSQTNFESSVNYTLQEYANDVVYQIQTVCDDAAVPHPNIMSESGRAIAAYHSVLVFGVLGVSGHNCELNEQTLPQNAPQPLVELNDTLRDLSTRNMIESFHHAQQLFELANVLFSTGHLSLEGRACAETLYWKLCTKIQELVETLEEVPDELSGLDRLLSDTYFCNFSLFQSIPDSWAIKQLFPVMPIHRLDEQPNRNAVIGDITCDSDGKIDRFINRRDVSRTLRLHEFDGAPYYLGAALVGAYQEILGDLHNLFGDTNAVHIDLTPQGDIEFKTLIKGDTVREVLHYVQFDDEDLLHRMQTAVERAVHRGQIDQVDAGRLLKIYEAGLSSYTYLDRPQGTPG